MIRRTISEYDIKHTGDEEERLEILHCLRQLQALVESAGLAGVQVSSEKIDLIYVRIETVDAP